MDLVIFIIALRLGRIPMKKRDQNFCKFQQIMPQYSYRLHFFVKRVSNSEVLRKIVNFQTVLYLGVHIF